MLQVRLTILYFKLKQAMPCKYGILVVCVYSQDFKIDRTSAILSEVKTTFLKFAKYFLIIEKAEENAGLNRGFNILSHG